MIWVKTVAAALVGLLLGHWLAQLVEIAGVALGDVGHWLVVILVAGGIGFSTFKRQKK